MVSQGSILGSIPFIYYIDDLPNDVTAKLLLLASDSKLIKVCCSEKGQLKFNISK